MTRMRPLRRLLPLVVLVAVVVGVTGCSLPEERGFTITHIDTQAVLNPDGSMDVVERATYSTETGTSIWGAGTASLLTKVQ